MPEGWFCFALLLQCLIILEIQVNALWTCSDPNVVELYFKCCKMRKMYLVLKYEERKKNLWLPVLKVRWDNFTNWRGRSPINDSCRYSARSFLPWWVSQHTHQRHWCDNMYLFFKIILVFTPYWQAEKEILENTHTHTHTPTPTPLNKL